MIAANSANIMPAKRKGSSCSWLGPIASFRIYNIFGFVVLVIILISFHQPMNEVEVKAITVQVDLNGDFKISF